jgi:Flp pilus assembly protein TadD
VIALLSLVVMGRLCGYEFSNWDDPATVRDNPAYNPPSARAIAQYWHKPFLDLYVPVTMSVWGGLAFLASGPRGGLNPHVYHSFNVLLHASTACAVFVLVRRFIGRSSRATWASAAGAALFAVHPVQVETVGWVSGAKDLLFAFFTLAALLGYVTAARTSKASRWIWYLLGTLAYALAMLSKPTAVVAPVMALIVDRAILRRPWRDVLFGVAPWALLAVPCVMWTKAVQPASHVVPPAVWLRPLVATDAMAFYLGKLFYPATLGIDYGRTPAAAIEHRWLYWTWLAPAAVTFILWAMRKRIPAAVPAGAMLAVAPMFPLLGLVPFDFQQFSTVSDHYLYLPMFGVALLVAGCLANVSPKIWAAPIAVVVAVLGVRSIAQAGTWADAVALARHTVEVNPNSVEGRVNLAAGLIDSGDALSAIPAAERAVEMGPNNLRARLALGAAQARLGRLADAEASLRVASTLGPRSSATLTALGELVAKQGRTDEAIAILREATEVDPEDPMPRAQLGSNLIQKREYAEAARELQLATKKMRDPNVEANLGIALARLGRPDEARQHLKRALAMLPSLDVAKEELERLGGE